MFLVRLELMVKHVQ